MNLGKVVEDVMQERRKALPRNNIRVAQWSNKELSKEISLTLET